MDDNELYFNEMSKSFISESEKLETSIDHLLQKFRKFSISNQLSKFERYLIIKISK